MAPAAKKDTDTSDVKAVQATSDEQAVEEAGSRRPTTLGDVAEVVRTVPNARTPSDDELKAEQERNDARKSDKLAEGDTAGPGIPPVQAAQPDGSVVAVSSDASEEEQQAAVAAQSHSGIVANPDDQETTTITLSGGDSVDVTMPPEQVSDKVSSGGIIQFPNEDPPVTVNADQVAKIEGS